MLFGVERFGDTTRSITGDFTFSLLIFIFSLLVRSRYPLYHYFHLSSSFRLQINERTRTEGHSEIAIHT